MIRTNRHVPHHHLGRNVRRNRSPLTPLVQITVVKLFRRTLSRTSRGQGVN
jgi:hypothetical protein